MRAQIKTVARFLGVACVSTYAAGCQGPLDAGPDLDFARSQPGCPVAFRLELENQSGEPVNVRVDDHDAFDLQRRRRLMVPAGAHTLTVTHPDAGGTLNVPLVVNAPTRATLNAAADGPPCTIESPMEVGQCEIYPARGERVGYTVNVVSEDLKRGVLTVDHYPPIPLSYRTEIIVPQGRHHFRVRYEQSPLDHATLTYHGPLNVLSASVATNADITYEMSTSADIRQISRLQVIGHFSPKSPPAELRLTPDVNGAIVHYGGS